MPDPDEVDEVIDGEIVPDPPADAPRAPQLVDLSAPDGYTADGVPTLSYVRNKISAALGAAEIFDESPQAVDERARQEDLRAATAAKLASLREELARPQITPPPPGESDQ